MYDIVYFLKDSPSNRELRYSLRSLSNFPHRKVWFYGGCPQHFKPDHHIKVEQNKENKWLNVREMLKLSCENNDISEDFWLFNDDFFIMKKVKEPKNYRNGDLYKRIINLENYYNRMTSYSKWLRICLKELESLGISTIDYETHTPFKINKNKALEVLNLTDTGGFRSIYGNYYDIDSIEHRDVKITDLNKLYKDDDYLSTDDKSFAIGKVGYQIRKRFMDKCKYEE